MVVAQMLGHSSTGIVMTYAKAIDEGRRDAIRKLEEFRQTHESPSAQSSIRTVIQ